MSESTKITQRAINLHYQPNKRFRMAKIYCNFLQRLMTMMMMMMMANQYRLRKAKKKK